MTYGPACPSSTLDRLGEEIDAISLFCYTKYWNETGVVFGWGRNQYGELTDQLNKDQLIPQEITTFGRVTNVFAGSGASYTIKKKELFAVGHNIYGHIGIGKEEDETHSYSVPEKVRLSAPIKNLVSGTTSFAIDISGRLWSWGANFYGNLGRTVSGTSRHGPTPELVDALRDYKVKQVSCGGYFACCLTSDGEVFTWGNPDFVGHGDIESSVLVPKKLDIEKIDQISCGWEHTLLLSADQKTVWAFGDYDLDLQEAELTTRPVKVPFLGETPIVKLQCGDECSAVLRADGKIMTWGLGRELNLHDPRVLQMEQKVIDIAMSTNFLLALTADNRLFAFGSNDRGQCGQGTKSPNFIPEPVEVKGLDNIHIKQISAGEFHSLIKCSYICH